MSVINMDCIEGMRAFPDNSFDSIVTDPPYELGFMGKAWDSTGIANNVEMWSEALRVLKPGGHLLAFSGSRTYHRMACAIEDAGFEVRDQIMWVYGSGFPKSLDVSKAIDKAAGAVREVTGRTKTPFKVDAAADRGRSLQGSVNGDFSKQVDDDGYRYTEHTAPATDAARQWEGWGTALKPAHEPICVARKPLIGTVAANVLAHGTGALNIDGCRVGNEERTYEPKGTSASAAMIRVPEHRAGKAGDEVTVSGRWPANLIHDGSAEVVALFPDAKGQQGATAARSQGLVYGDVSAGQIGVQPRDDSGSAARFFYCAKTSKADRNSGLEEFTPDTTSDGRAVAADNAYQRGKTERANTHPTVKPTDLMAYLCRLVTPPGGVILDPFAGSGSTGKAAAREGFQFVGFELSAEYTAIANARIEHMIHLMKANNV